MLLTLSEPARAFQAEVRAFLDSHLDDDLRRASRLTTGVYSDIEAGRRWHEMLYQQGWSAPTWPREFGGPGWDSLEVHIFNSECFAAGAPVLFNMGVRHLGPILMARGTPDQQARYLPAILSGEHIWCQGYSEPGAGSDLASLKLRADRDGNDYVLNGTKIWTTGAHFATHMFCLARTSDTGPKQAGITFLLLEMDSPGLTVEPIISLAGDHELNQVFFDDVRVPVANRVGDEGDGWRVAKALMQHARSNNVNTGWVRASFLRLVDLASAEPDGQGGALIDEPQFRTKVSEAEIFLDRLQMLELRILAALSAGESPGALSSVLKTLGSELKQRLSELALEAVSWYGLPVQPEALNPWARPEIIGPPRAVTAAPTYFNERAATIYSGTSEIQRDVIARSVLGL